MPDLTINVEPVGLLESNHRGFSTPPKFPSTPFGSNLNPSASVAEAVMSGPLEPCFNTGMLPFLPCALVNSGQ
jgi:hypothetical protein